MLGSTSRARAAAALAVLAGAGLAALPMTSATAVPVSNACYNTVNSTIAPVGADFTATVPASVTPGGTVDVTNLKATVTMPGAVFVSGYNLGLVQDGGSVSGQIKATIAGTGSVEGQKDTNLVSASLGPVNINDPDGVRATGDETAEPVSTSVTFNDMSFTAGASGKVDIREASVPISNASGGGGLQIDANLGFTVKFRCSPGTVDTTTNTAQFGPGAVIASTDVVVPPGAPVALDDSLTVGANQGGSVNVVANDTDPNGDIDPASVIIVDGPTKGTAVANADGTVTYTNTDTASTDSFTYTVKDKGGLISNKATVSVTIESDTGGPGADLNQVVEVVVTGDALTMKQAGAVIALPGVKLNGKPQQVLGDINGITVVNATGSGAAWSLTGQMTSDYSNGVGSGVCPASDKTKWNRNCIPAGNTGWAPSASVSHDVIPGDVAAVKAGAPLPQGGLDKAAELCSAAAETSGGTFSCGGKIGLGIPASAGAGSYKAILTLTLV
jgi:hypothetical protein